DAAADVTGDVVSDAPSGPPCGSVTCAVGQVCCDPCVGQCVDARAGIACPNAADAAACTCGTEGKSCCGSQTGCSPGLTCCTGNPYPASGSCETSCTL